jgi:hypothetical protein
LTNPTSNYGFVLPTSTDLVTDLPADFEVALQGVDTRLKALQPGTTLGDIAYSSATANTNTRLPIGTTGQVLAVSGGVPAWTTTADVTPLTTKGDLFTFTTVDARIGVGANGTILTADSAEATGLKWAAPATVSSGLTLINTTTFSAVTSISIDSLFSSTYDNYQIVFTTTTTSAGADIKMKLRSGGADNSSNDYFTQVSYMQSGALTNLAGTSTTGFFIAAATNILTTSIINLSNPNLATSTKSGVFSTMGGTNQRYTFGGFYKQNSTQFTGLSMITDAPTMTGQISIYGLAK